MYTINHQGYCTDEHLRSTPLFDISSCVVFFVKSLYVILWFTSLPPHNSPCLQQPQWNDSPNGSLVSFSDMILRNLSPYGAMYHTQTCFPQTWKSSVFCFMCHWTKALPPTRYPALLIDPCNKYLPVSLPPVDGCTAWLVVRDEGGGANFPPGGGGRRPSPPELWGRVLSFFFDCWKWKTGHETRKWEERKMLNQIMSLSLRLMAQFCIYII